MIENANTGYLGCWRSKTVYELVKLQQRSQSKGRYNDTMYANILRKRVIRNWPASALCVASIDWQETPLPRPSCLLIDCVVVCTAIQLLVKKILHVFLFFFFLFTFFSGKLHTYVFTFYSIVAMLLCVVCSLLDGVCLSKNKRITYLLTYLVGLLQNLLIACYNHHSIFVLGHVQDFDNSREKICWLLINHFYVIRQESYRIRWNNAK